MTEADAEKAGYQSEDEDSLFGSPPASPIRGRSPSPTLALPSTSSAAQNVGTIALPGSHPSSELPINPSALLSSFAHLASVPQPQIPCQEPLRPVAITPSPVTSISPSSSRASSAAPSFRPRKYRAKKSQSRSKESTPRPTGPEIQMPNPSEPLPANFLRSQSALLGTAGLVGGVKPVNLTTNRDARGSTPSNPIVVDDEEDRPILGRNSRLRQIPPIDPSLLPTPSTQDIVTMLVGQKDIFPVLENLLRLISGTSPAPPPQSSAFFRSQSQTPTPPLDGTFRPLKRRKLSRVPAGAVDWDVPYPFAQGEGPELYRTNWERQRGKQLVSQLLSLIKLAAYKAAAKLYYQDLQAQRSEGTVQPPRYSGGPFNPYQPLYGQGISGAPIAADLGPPNAGSDKGKAPVTAMSAQGSAFVATSQVPSAQSRHEPPTPFDQLIYSLMSASPEKTASSVTAVSSQTPDKSMGPHSDSIFPGIDQELLSGWLNLLESQHQQISPSTAQNSTSSTPQCDDLYPLGYDPDLLDFDFTKIMTSHTSNLPSSVAYTNTDPESAFGGYPAPQVYTYGHDPTRNFPAGQIPDHLIDPDLLLVSSSQQSQQPMPSGATESPPNSLPSTAPSSVSPTRTSGDIDLSISTSTSLDVAQVGCSPSLYARQPQIVSHDGSVDVGGINHSTPPGDKENEPLVPAQDKGKSKDTSVVEAQIPIPNASSSTTNQRSVPRPSVARPLANKDDVLKRAYERRKELTDELEKVKTQLWETTIEQGALGYLCRHLKQ